MKLHGWQEYGTPLPPSLTGQARNGDPGSCLINIPSVSGQRVTEPCRCRGAELLCCFALNFHYSKEKGGGMRFRHLLHLNRRRSAPCDRAKPAGFGSFQAERDSVLVLIYSCCGSPWVPVEARVGVGRATAEAGS